MILTIVDCFSLQFVSPLTREGEIDFCKKLLECGVYIGPGCEFSCAESGWFRIIFSVPPATLKVGKSCFVYSAFVILSRQQIWGVKQVPFILIGWGYFVGYWEGDGV